MRVLQVIPSISLVYGGPSQMVLGLSAALATQGVEVTIVTTDANGDQHQPPLQVPLQQLIDQDGYEIIYFRCTPFRRYKFSLALGRWLWQHIQNYDLVHIHALFSPVSTIAASIARHRGIPYILRPLGTLDPLDLQKKKIFKQIYGWLWERPNLQGAAAIHFTSQQEALTAHRFGAKTHDLVIPLGVTPPPNLDLFLEQSFTGLEDIHGERQEDFDRNNFQEDDQNHDRSPESVGEQVQRHAQSDTQNFSEDFSVNMAGVSLVEVPTLETREDLGRGNPLILFLSRIDRKKGLDLLIPVLEDLLAEGWKFHFVLAGANPQDQNYTAQIKQQITNSPLGKSTIITGFVAGDYKRQLLQQADLLVLPSYYENFGIAVAEAMIVGTPVLISDRVQIWQEVLEAGGGWVCSCDRASLLTQLRAALGDELARQQRGRNAQKYAWQNYRWESIAHRTQQIYRNLIQNSE
ncbi:MAG: glycosyltransferase [Coleofasciculaceae cyanobacterium SM2_1_6]|nr:glycosyltransferase [Coleofasciculaceae cyanobacterium SM2_1_6]